jgi:aminocarboxymuconate-semialdehyde decarboxylase
MDLGARLAAMDEFGIDRQVLSPNPLTFLAGVEASIARDFSRRHNDALAELVARAPDRLLGFAQLPTQDPAGAAAELERATRDLGLVGAYLATDLGRPLDDPSHDELWGAFEALDVPAVLHPVPGGIDRPVRDERLRRFDGDLWIGFAYEETLAVAALVLGGVLDRFPALDVAVTHGGGASSWLAERMEHAARTRPWGPEHLAEPGAVAERLRRIWWDAHVGGPGALAALVAAFGTERLLGGTNLAGWDACGDPAHGDADLAAILDANARRFVRLDRSTK